VSSLKILSKQPKKKDHEITKRAKVLERDFIRTEVTTIRGATLGKKKCASLLRLTSGAKGKKGRRKPGNQKRSRKAASE